MIAMASVIKNTIKNGIINEFDLIATKKTPIVKITFEQCMYLY